MKRSIILIIALLVFSNLLNAQTKTTNLKYEFIWINFGMGGGAVLSTNIINSGAVMPFYMDIYLQNRRNRFGVGIAHELYLTPQNLFRLFTGNSSNTEKIYFTYEWMVLPNFPVNIGACAQFGGFLVGNEIKEANTSDSVKVTDYNMFGNIGLVAEVGIRPFFIFVKPYLEFKNYGNFHKEILGVVSFGVKFKFMSEEEKKRRADKKKKRKNR